jgi:hypothetical protein
VTTYNSSGVVNPQKSQKDFGIFCINTHTTTLQNYIGIKLNTQQDNIINNKIKHDNIISLKCRLEWLESS